MTAAADLARSAGRGRLAWKIIGAIATVITIASVGSGLWFLTSFHPRYRTATETAQYGIAQHGGRVTEVSVQLSNGNITIAAGPAGQVAVTRLLRWTSARPVIDEHWDQGELDISQDCPTGLFEQTCSVSYQITVPPGVPLNLTTSSGNVTTTGIRSTNVQASTGSGDIWLDFATAPTQVNAQTSSGDVTVKVPRGASYVVVANADNGLPDLGVPDAPGSPRSITAQSSNGDVTIGYS